MPAYDVLVYGPIFCDLIFTGLPDVPNLGKELFADHLTVSLGGSAIVASGLRRLGLKVGLIADLGGDPFSQIVWGLLQENDIDVSLIRKTKESLKQVTVALSYPEDRAFVTRFEQLNTPIDLSGILQDNPTQHLHICSFLAALDNPEAAQTARSVGASVSADFGWDEKALLDPKLLKLVAELDVFLPSKAEIFQMMQDSHLESAAEKMLSTMKHGDLIVKVGRRGVIGFQKDTSDPKHVPAISVEAVDTTGAGDAFDAGFLFAYLNKMSMQDCLMYGVICGGLTTTIPGGTEGFPSDKEIEEWLSKLQS